MDSIAANYPSDESDSDSGEVQLSLEAPLARIPAEVIEKYKLEPNTSKYEDMSLGGLRAGSQRWCTFLYYEWRPSRLERAQLMQIVTRINDFCQKGNMALTRQLHFEPLCLSPLGAPLSLHISLSQSIVFEREAERELLYDKLKERIRSASRLKSFTMKFQPTLELLPSFGKDTLFLALPVSAALKSTEMASINNIIHEAAAETFPGKTGKEIQGLTCMPATTHMSIALAANVPKSVLENLNFISTLLPMELEDAASFEFPVSGLKFDKNRQILSIPFN
ncbi:hypothetical protein HG536_0C01290 [Torulaspora globosa]|uniref:U6 snRNA phosphodiesterase n=1 Tax=Torulaspora globosa TaxID=48254 RepID=A0A7G3ZEM5_9SACH|nr:uncharacterized protein HG536_0C01290 [Torulaspora globosa]QLL31961.1 hypothetical protein HG536_0C01290 [Torulaspora globosa]